MGREEREKMNYLDLMNNFSVSDLQKILGKEIIENLNEWNYGQEDKWSKTKLVSMIDTLYGINILKNQFVREKLLLAMQENQIEELSRKYLADKQAGNLQEACKLLSEKIWGNNSLSLELLSIWGLNRNIFENTDKRNLEIVSKVISDERFYELLDYQFFIKQRVLNILNSTMPLGKVLVHMPTGTGKTKTAMHIITNFIEFTLKKTGIVIWVAHTTELLEQAYSTFCSVWKHLGDGEINVYKLWGNTNIYECSEPLNGIVFCGLGKLMAVAKTNKNLISRLVNDCRLFVFDEAHKAAAPETKKIIDAFMIKKSGMENRFLLGLTATPGRTSNYSDENKNFSIMFENRIISIDSEIINYMNLGKQVSENSYSEKNIIKYFQERKILSKMEKEELEYVQNFSDEELCILKSSFNQSAETDFTDKQLEIFARNKNRNQAILAGLRRMYSLKKPTIVFACSVLHAKMLSAILRLEEIPSCVVTGDMNPIDRKKAIDSFKDRNNPCNIIINFDVLTTGFDSKNIQCVFITRPTKSIVLYSQMLGRGLRGPLMGGQEKCLLIDVKDNLASFDNEKSFSYFDSYWNK